MFNQKQQQLIKTQEREVTTANGFVKAAMKVSNEITSGNGALKYKSSGNPFTDQFAKLGSYKAPRTFAEIAADCEELWANNREFTVKFLFYIRTINRKVQFFNGETTTEPQKGGELKHEGIMRMIWLHMKSPEIFWNNIGLFISAGSWKDVIQMLSYDLQFNGWNGRVLNWEKFGNLILTSLENKNTSELLKKYLPTIRTLKKCRTLESQADNIIAKWICSLLFGNKGEESGWTYKKYRQLKSSGTAHEWQQLISQRKFERIDFSKIHGRALSLLVRGKFLHNQGLSEKYASWVGSPETKEVKYTGFVHELFQPYASSVIFRRVMNDRTPILSLASVQQHVQDTINKQFQTLVNKGGEQNQTNLIVVRDTSGSMGHSATGTSMACYDVAKALALYFSEFLTGQFANSWIEFNSDAQMHQWKGETPLEKWFNDNSGFVGGTNFQSVIQLFVRLKGKGIRETDFPCGFIAISDSEFNPAQLDETNVETAKKALLAGGFSQEYVDNFVIVLWNLQSRAYGRGTGEKFETYGNVPNVFYFSGYSASVISFLTSKIRTPDELFESAMEQELLSMIEV